MEKTNAEESIQRLHCKNTVATFNKIAKQNATEKSVPDTRLEDKMSF
jgi:hypothetical protein